jgi:hypothetical protein
MLFWIRGKIKVGRKIKLKSQRDRVNIRLRLGVNNFYLVRFNSSLILM